MPKEEELCKALAAILAIIDGYEMMTANSIAWLHGYSVDPSIAVRNSQIINDAYRLLGEERPLIGIGEVEIRTRRDNEG